MGEAGFKTEVGGGGDLGGGGEGVRGRRERGGEGRLSWSSPGGGRGRHQSRGAAYSHQELLNRPLTPPPSLPPAHPPPHLVPQHSPAVRCPPQPPAAAPPGAPPPAPPLSPACTPPACSGPPAPSPPGAPSPRTCARGARGASGSAARGAAAGAGRRPAGVGSHPQIGRQAVFGGWKRGWYVGGGVRGVRKEMSRCGQWGVVVLQLAGS